MKKVLALILTLVFAISILAGCGTGTAGQQAADTKAAEKKVEATVEAKAAGPIIIKLPTYKTRVSDAGGKFFVPQVERFNKKFEGKYKVELEEVPGDSYNAKIKELEQQNMLPALVEGGEKEWFEKVVIANNKYLDLASWLDSKPDLKARMIPDSVSYATKSGKVVSLPLVKLFTVGMYYNSTMITPGKRFGEMTLDEFEAALGDNKIAFMTSENAWTSNLFLTSIIVKNGGADILRKGASDARITEFSSDIWVNSFTDLQRFLQKHASANTVGAAYADAANAFMSKRAAIIPNGPWMMGEFQPTSKDKWSNGFDGEQVKGEMYPGNVSIGLPQQYWWWIPASTPKDQVEAAQAFLEFITSPDEVEAWMLDEGGTTPNMQLSDKCKAELAKNRLLNELTTAVNDKTILVPAFSDAAHPSVGDTNGAFPVLLPKLIDGSMTPKQFADELTKRAQEAIKQ